MSRFFTKTLSMLTPYTPGEQPQDMSYIKLNTNESPYAPSEKAMETAAGCIRSLNLYPDPSCALVVDKLAELYGVSPEEVILGNGSDELLFISFKAYCDAGHQALFPDITYGFYPVFAAVNCVPYTEIPLREDFSIALEDYYANIICPDASQEPVKTGAVYIANPNAPTGMVLEPGAIGAFAAENPDTVVIVDEAYVDFGAESCVPLIKEHDNLLVIQTFSKSRSLAGGRIGFAIGNRRLIQDLNTIKYSLNPYNINSMTMAAAYGVLCDEETVRTNCRSIAMTRDYTVQRLRALGFEVLESRANFIFARTDGMEGGRLYRELKARGILVRHFDKARISDYVRITIGTREQIDALIKAICDTLRV